MLKRGNVKLPTYMTQEAFTFNYNDKREVELEFRPKKIKKEE